MIEIRLIEIHTSTAYGRRSHTWENEIRPTWYTSKSAKWSRTVLKVSRDRYTVACRPVYNIVTAMAVTSSWNSLSKTILSDVKRRGVVSRTIRVTEFNNRCASWVEPNVFKLLKKYQKIRQKNTEVNWRTRKISLQKRL